MGNTNELSFTVASEKKNGAIRFYVEFNRTPTAEETAAMRAVTGVNVSRGNTNRVAIPDFVGGNGGGAHWDGVGIHSAYAEGQFVKRVMADFASSWSAAKARIAADKAAAVAKAAAAEKAASLSSARTILGSFNGN